MPTFQICAPKNETVFEVEYYPRDHSIDRVLVNGKEFDPDGLFVAVPVGKLGGKMVPLRSFLTNAAGKMFSDDEAAQAEHREDERAAAAEYNKDY